MLENIDIIVVANNLNAGLWSMTSNTLRTATENANMAIGKVVTIEQCRTARMQKIGETKYYDFPFNYNKCLNLGLYLTESKYVALCNNDLYFNKNWAKNAVQAMKAGGYLSASPTGKHIFEGVIEGYDIGIKGQLLGWCIIIDRDLLGHIGSLSEVVDFWYSDDAYAVQLRCAGLKHALVGNSVVTHFKSRTLYKVKTNRAKMTKGQKKIFEQYKNEMYANSGIEIEVKGRNNNRR